MKRLSLVILLLSFGAIAESNPSLEKYFLQKLEQVQSTPMSEAGYSTETAFVIQDINFDLAATLSFGVGEVLNLTISPEIDFVFTPPVGE